MASSPHSKWSTPLHIQEPAGGDGNRSRFASLAPLPPPSFLRPTPMDLDHGMKNQAESMRKMHIGDMSVDHQSDDEQDDNEVFENHVMGDSSFLHQVFVG